MEYRRAGVNTMLETRSLPFEVPSYSLTGDVLAFQRCALQYRYYNGSSLPPSRPVQMWVGEFTHGVLEEAYRQWNLIHPPFPWPHTPANWPPDANSPLPDHDIGKLGQRVEVRLAATGKTSRNRNARASAYSRVEVAINQLAPHLFPLISAAEQRISGTRAMPRLALGRNARGDRYELTGVIDVISSVVLGGQDANVLVQLIEQSLPRAGQEYDIIVDYKATRRPPPGSDFGRHYEWQIQTYAWLKRQMLSPRPVGAGLLIFVNELGPTAGDLEAFKREIQNGEADVTPERGSADYYAINTWRPETPVPALSFEFRLRRAVRVIDVSPPAVENAARQIDNVVSNIEQCAVSEHNSGSILHNWRSCGSAQECSACDFEHFCPSPHGHREAAANGPRLPAAPG
jgi:hypothetical protein